MRAYLDLLQRVLDEGVVKSDRTGVGVTSIFGAQSRFDLRAGFPLLTTKKLHTKSIVHELLWFLRGATNIRYLKENGVSIWDEWADENGELGPVYGKQWRSWAGADGKTYDQIAWLVNEIKTNPFSRRLWSRPGTRPRSSRWRSRLAIACSSSMSPKWTACAAFRASFTSAQPISSWACRGFPA